MSKKKRSKILATLLCATTMAAFYASPQIGYAVSLNQKEDGTVTTDSGGTNTAILNIEGIESITFGVQGDMETGGVNLYFDGTGTYGGLVANGSLTATDLYITVENDADGDNYNSNRYSLKNALGIHRTGTGDKAITNIEANSLGHGGMQVSSDTVSILDGAAVFTNKTTSDNGGTISFSSAFNSEQGMTVGTNFVLDSTGKISKVNGIDVQGALTTTGTINSMTIRNNQVNGVTLNNGNVTANEVTVGSYKLSEVGSLANTINQKTMGIASYDASNGTTFNGKITAYAGVVTNSISDGSVSFRVSDAKDVIDAVNDSDIGLEATNDLAKKNEEAIVSLGNKVDTFDGRITKNTDDIGTLNTKTTGMSYDASSGTTFAQAVTANDFKIAGGTSLSQVATDLTTAKGKIQTNTDNITSLTGKVTTAESEIDVLQTTVGNQSSGLVKNVNDLNTTVSGHTTSISDLSGRVGTAETDIDKLQTTVGDESSGLVKNVNDLNTTVSGHTTSINDLTGRVGTAETDIDNLQATVGDENSGLVAKTKNLNADGSTLTGMDNITTNTFTATSGSIGSISFSGNNLTNVASIGGVDNTVTVAGTAISNGSFNGVSIYKDANDYIVGDVNISALKGVSGTEIEGIKRTSNNGGGFTTTIEENLAVSTDGTIKQTNGDFAVDTDGNVTGKDFKVNGTSLGDVASAVNDQTKGLKATYDIASANQAAITDEETGLGALNNKTTGMTYTAGTTTADGITEFDHKLKATAFETENLTATEGNIGGISFETVNGVKTIGTDSDTITLAGNAISKGSFNGVSIGVDGSNRATFNGVSIYTDSANENDVMVGGINISDLQSGSAEITNKLRGITYSNESGNDYTMTFAGVMSVSTEGEYKFKYNGNEYGLDDLINTVSSEDLAGFEELKKKVDKLEDKTTGIEFDEGTGSTTINDMDKDSSGNWVKGDNSLTVGDDGITANGDTVINGDTDDNTTGGNGNDSNDPQGGDSIINGDQLVDGDQHVTGDSQFDGTITVGSGTDGKGQTVIDGGNITTGDTVIDGGQVKADEGYFGNITVGEGDNQTTIGDDGIKVGDNTTIDNSGVSIKDENGNVFMGDHDVVIKDSDGNVEASLSDVANRVDGIEQSIGDLNSRMGELEDRIDKVGAMAAAIANLRTMGYDPAAPTEVAVGIGQYRNETGAALGLFHYPNRDFMLSLSVSTSGDEVMGGIGATWKFGRKSPEKVAAEKAEKAREAKLQKAEAIKEAARLKKIEAQQERHAKLAAQKTATK